MWTILGAVKCLAGNHLLPICFCVLTLVPGHAQSQDLDTYKLRVTGFWWFSQPSGYFQGANHSGEFDLSKDFDFGSYSTFTGALDWRFKKKQHLLFGITLSVIPRVRFLPEPSHSRAKRTT
jgi:hypothetical protein